MSGHFDDLPPQAPAPSPTAPASAPPPERIQIGPLDV